ncbi:MAG: ABC transporter ATP-binding protein [Anaerolineae bacterium]|nr:ABC transporter ATP-binding protein [Anaerolineae bacterium]
MAAVAASEAPFVSCENLVKIYKIADLEVVALQGLDLQVAKGELLAIVGSSGSGKSTLLNILGGLDRPTAGKVTVGGVDLLKLSARALTRYRRDKVGFVWQQTSRNLIPYLTAQENVELPMLMAGKSPRLAREWARELLDAVELGDRRSHRLAQLSGGQQQRVAIALALANDPELLLADEPTGEMDSATARVIWDTFRRLNARFGLTTIIVTHDPKIAQEVDRVVSIRDGKTSTETVRQVAPENQHAGAGAAAELLGAGEATYEEYVVLDGAGRLQVPREYLEQWGIGTRAKLELVEDGILIKPINGGRPGPAETAEAGRRTSLYYEEDAPPEPAHPRWRRRLGGLASRFGRSRKR